MATNSEIGIKPNPSDSDNDPVTSKPPSNQTPKRISIVVTGITGSGKSALVNSILGLNDDDKRAKEGDKADATCTTKVTKYKLKRDNTAIKVWDTPGLLDGTRNQEVYLKKIMKKCSQRNVTIHCVKVSEARFVRGYDNLQVRVMNMLTREDKLGSSFWENTIIALTFADVLWFTRNIAKGGNLTQKEKQTAFNEEIENFKSSIQDTLIHDVKVPEEVVDTITFAHTGHYSDPHELDTDSWLKDLRSQYLARYTEIEDEKEIAKQKTKKAQKKGSIVGGFLGILGGPLMLVTIPVGAYIGNRLGKRIAENRVKPCTLEED